MRVQVPAPPLSVAGGDALPGAEPLSAGSSGCFSGSGWCFVCHATVGAPVGAPPPIFSGRPAAGRHMIKKEIF